MLFPKVWSSKTSDFICERTRLGRYGRLSGPGQGRLAYLCRAQDSLVGPRCQQRFRAPDGNQASASIFWASLNVWASCPIGKGCHLSQAPADRPQEHGCHHNDGDLAACAGFLGKKSRQTSDNRRKKQELEKRVLASRPDRSWYNDVQQA